jgi:membrane fusion protein (multidrug efflux system)
MAGTGAAFSLFPPENASGNFVKVVQRIPVKIEIDEDGNNSLTMLRIGMSVVPTIITGN